MAKPKKADEDVIEILQVSTGQIECCVLGSTPLILNRMSEKAKRELLMPKGRKSAMEKATTLKHAPLDEFRASAYRFTDESLPTYLGVLSTSFKGAMRSAALDLPGAKKAQVGRLTYVNGDYVGVYGIPKLFMSVTRSADMNKTPDVRTRAIVPTWACRVVVTFVQPLMRAQAVVNLLAAAGLSIGVGDWRPEKGSGNYGQFRIVAQDDPDYLAIIANGGRAAQKDAMDTPECYDDETADLLSWFDTEVKRRKLIGVA